MSIFQFFLIVGVLALLYFALRLLPGEKSLALKRIFGVIAGGLAILAITFPNLLTLIANKVGIGRGTDLLLYLFIIFTLFLSIALLRAKARSDARVTELARAVALLESRLKDEIDKSNEEQ